MLNNKVDDGAEIINQILSNDPKSIPQINKVFLLIEKFINSFSEYDANDKNTLHIILSVEGGHAFYYGKNQYSDSNQIIDNLRKFKGADSEHRLLYITLVHLERSGFGNHAYANKIFSKKPFLPKGNGLTSQGNDFQKRRIREAN